MILSWEHNGKEKKSISDREYIILSVVVLKHVLPAENRRLVFFDTLEMTWLKSEQQKTTYITL